MKFPVYFLHFWLPKAHVEAPTRARMLLAGLLLKIGTGGFLRLTFLLRYQFVGGAVFVAFLGRVFCSAMCFFQRDLKALAALSSVNHMSFLLLLLLLQREFFKWGAVFIIVAHGFVSVLLFFFIGEVYHISYSRIFYFLGGVFFSNFVFLFFFFFV
jgi:NADH:ubiquinone oxidoreductase subunit 4 (subunit M)